MCALTVLSRRNILTVLKIPSKDGATNLFAFTKRTVLIHESDDHVRADRVDILIKGNKISRIAKSIPSESGAEVIDCTDKIISPGFVDTHHHVWQTQLRGRHANDTLLNCITKGNVVAAFYSPEDLFWGQLAGCWEMINGGTTTVVDYSHVNYSLENSESTILSGCAIPGELTRIR